MQEELEFKNQLHQSEISEARTRMEYTLDEVDSRTQKEAEHRLQEALADLRRQQEAQTQVYKVSMESMYESKVIVLSSFSCMRSPAFCMYVYVHE